MIHESVLAPSAAFICAAICGISVRVAQATPHVPDWVEHGAAFGFISCLIYAVVVLWKRNRELAQENKEDRELFHREVRGEMQAQIDAERASRDRLTAVLEKLADKVT